MPTLAGRAVLHAAALCSVPPCARCCAPPRLPACRCAPTTVRCAPICRAPHVVACIDSRALPGPPPNQPVPCCAVPRCAAHRRAHAAAHHHRIHRRHVHRCAVRTHPLHVLACIGSRALPGPPPTPCCCCAVHMPLRCLDAAAPCACRRTAAVPTAALPCRPHPRTPIGPRPWPSSREC